MQPSRAFVCLAPGLAAAALLAATAAPALAIDPPRGRSGAASSSAPELTSAAATCRSTTCSPSCPTAEPGSASGGARRRGPERVHVFIDPRSGAATNIMAPFPLLPGDGVGNRVRLAELGARLGRDIARVDAAVVAEAARAVRAGARGAAGHRPEPARGAAGHAGLGHAVAGERAADGQRHPRARRAAGAHHQPRQRGHVRHRELGHGTRAHQAGDRRREGDQGRLRLRGRPRAARRRGAAPRLEIVATAPAGTAPTRPIWAGRARATSTGWCGA